jgi:hypothetical protein
MRVSLYVLIKAGFGDTTIVSVFAYTPEQALEIIYDAASTTVRDELNEFYSAINDGATEQFALRYALLRYNTNTTGVAFMMGDFSGVNYCKYIPLAWKDISGGHVPKFKTLLQDLAYKLKNKNLPFKSKVKKFPKKYEKAKYHPGGTKHQAHLLFLERCTDAMMKFSREELVQAAKRVGAEFNANATKEEICNAINRVYFEPEMVQPEVMGPYQGRQSSKESPKDITFKSKSLRWAREEEQ